MTTMNSAKKTGEVRKRPGVGAQFASQEELLNVAKEESVVFDFGDYRFLIRKANGSLRVSTEWGRDRKGPRIALRISQGQEIILWGEWANEPNPTR